MTDRAELAEFLGLVAFGMSDRKTQDKLYEAASALSAQQPVAWAVLHNGEFVGNVRIAKVQAERMKADLDAKYPDDKREVVPLYTSPPPVKV